MKWVIFQSLGGLGLFLFGMKIMSEGLQKVAGKKMRQILAMVWAVVTGTNMPNMKTL